MYLFHLIIAIMVLFNLKLNMQARGVMLDDLGFWWVFSGVLLVVPLTIVVSAVTYLLIERPFMNLRKGYRPSLTSDKTISSGESAPYVVQGIVRTSPTS